MQTLTIINQPLRAINNMASSTKISFALSILLLVLCLGPGLSEANGQEQRNAYSINPGDSLLISVWREEGLSIEVLVTPDGNCTFPLIGQVRAAGRTSEAVADEVVERLKQFMPDPVVVVSVVSILGNKIYIIGQVNNPGEYVMNNDLDVMQALSVAGGATPFAELNDIKILRRTPTGQMAIGFRYNEVVRGRNLEQNIVLRSGDLIVVP